MCVDKDYASIGNVECRDCAAYKVLGAGAVDNVQFLIEEFCIEHSGENGVAVFFFNGEIVGYGVLGVYGAATFYNTTFVEHSFCECGFTGALAAEQGDVFDFFGLISFHAIGFNSLSSLKR